MKYFSTNNKSALTSFREAVIKGLPDDNGLFFPEKIPTPSILKDVKGAGLQELAFEMLREYTAADISRTRLLEIATSALSFNIPLVQVQDDIGALELFHGPTLAFKDVGARFLARILRELTDEKLTILVATSGDTGSAVANGFYGVEGIDVVILYPSGKISEIQEKQLTTLGGNITALEIDGVFDDCQRLVKSAFLDPTLKNKIKLTSANSINIMRWIPQSIYYAWAKAQSTAESPVFSVPSGNFGNLAAGVLASKMGLSVGGFIAATNSNHVVPDYLSSGEYHPTSSVPTISNAMDVGDPSNFPRLLELYNQNHGDMAMDIKGYWQDDDQTRSVIQNCKLQNGYMLDPHGAIAYKAACEFNEAGTEMIFLETAHPAKFKDVIDSALDTDIEIPSSLEHCLQQTKESTLMSADFSKLKEFLADRA